jgi:hypothetical protein
VAVVQIGRSVRTGREVEATPRREGRRRPCAGHRGGGARRRRREELEAAAGEEARLRAVLYVRRSGGGGTEAGELGANRGGAGQGTSPGRVAAGLARRPPEISPAAGDLAVAAGQPVACGGGARLQGRGSDGGGGARRPPAGAGRGAPAEALSRAETWRRGEAAASGWVGWGQPGV